MKKIKTIHLLGIFLLIFIIFPIIYLLFQVFNDSKIPLQTDLLVKYIVNTIIMVVVVGLFTGFLGCSLAWIITFYKFKYRNILKIMLALPLAIPPYIAAFSYSDFTYKGGILNRVFNIFKMDLYFDMANFYGAIFIYIITLYPYVYLMCLSFYKYSSESLIDNARVLKAGSKKMFFKVGLPMARLPIIAGVTLAIMELVSDFGVVDYYGVQAFSTGIYKVWLNYDDFNSAIKLSAIFLILILSIIVFESIIRKRLRYFTSTKTKSFKLIDTKLKGRRFIYFYTGFVIFFSFIIPVTQLLYNAYFVFGREVNLELFKVIGSTIYYSAIPAIICVVISFIIANYTRDKGTLFKTFISRLATMGYSVPGVIIGLAVIFTFIDIDKLLVPIYRIIGIQDKVLVLSTSVFLLVFAYVVRFLAVSYNNIYSSYRKINPNLFRASHTLGKNDTKTFFRVDLPLMMPSLLTSFLLVFLEIIKELPITLMLKPYNIETLTSRVYTFTHNEQYTEASIPSLSIIVIGVFVMLVTILYRENSNDKS